MAEEVFKKVEAFIRKPEANIRKGEGEKHIDLLAEALADLDEDLSLTQTEEARLRDKISNLINREKDLDKKKENIRQNLELVKEKISKLTKISDELKRV